MKYMGMTVLAAGLALTAAYFYGAQSVGSAIAGEQSCSFDVNSVTGVKKMRSQLTAVLDASSPSGAAVPSGFTHVLRVNMTAEEGCEPVTFEKWVGTLAVTDGGNRNWARLSAMEGMLVLDADTGDVVTTGVASKLSTSAVDFTMGQVVIHSGETRALDFYVDTTYASEENDDTAMFSLKENSFQWSDGRKTVREMNETIAGNVLVF